MKESHKDILNMEVEESNNTRTITILIARNVEKNTNKVLDMSITCRITN